jgi:hypothetical protein
VLVAQVVELDGDALRVGARLGWRPRTKPPFHD